MFLRDELLKISEEDHIPEVDPHLSDIWIVHARPIIYKLNKKKQKKTA